ncbi:MAG TPA: APC family permease [Longimicrobiales bacterium]|nr:APC family permease [Longimicrobiales bacterium]
MAATIGNTIGAGILRTPGEIAQHLRTPWLFMSVWIAGGLYALLGALSLAELGAMIPKSGGQTVFVRRALGGYAGFVVGWSDWISTCASTALISLVIGEYTGILLPGAPADALLALLVALGFGLLHARGVRLAGQTQIVTSAAKAIAFLLLILACFLLGGAKPSVATTDTGLSALGVVLALQAVIYTYDGWTGPIYFSEEVRDPGRDIPRAMVAGVLAVMAIYLLTNAGFLYVLPLEQMAGQPLVAATAANTIFGARGELIIRLLTIVSMLSAINALTLMAPRVLYALGDRGLIPSARRVDERGTPVVALAVSTVVTAAIIATGTVQTVIALAAFFFVANYALSFLSQIVLRRREPETARPYRTWGYPWTTVIVLAGSLAFLVAAVSADTRTAVYSIGLLGLSYPAYLLLKRRTA